MRVRMPICIDTVIAQHTADAMNVSAVIVMMGSNDKGALSIKMALNQLAVFGFIQPLTYHISQDHTGRSSNPYHNQAVILYFIHSLSLREFVMHLKQIEQRCGRCERKNSAKHNYLVAMDLDIIAVMTDDWHIICERLPLKEYELMCLSKCSKNHA